MHCLFSSLLVSQDVEQARPGVEVRVALKGPATLRLALGAVVLREAAVHDVPRPTQLGVDVVSDDGDCPLSVRCRHVSVQGGLTGAGDDEEGNDSGRGARRTDGCCDWCCHCVCGWL